MGINMKLTLYILASVIILSLSVVLIAKFIAIPIKMIVSDKEKQITELKQDKEKLSIVVADAAAALQLKLAEKELIKLKAYITTYTDVLTPQMIESAAIALIKSSTTNDIPLALVVGIAQATSKFNTTYLTEEGHRGILALPKKYWINIKDTKNNVNYVEIGTEVCCGVLKSIFKDTSDIHNILIIYFDELYAKKYEESIYKYALMYECYSK